MSSDRRQEDRVPVAVRVRMQYPDVDTFVERYATNVSRGGIFIQSQRTQPTGTLIRFEFQLQDKSAVIRGEGRVAWSVPFDSAHPERTYGMGVRFTRLDVKSKKIIDEMVGQRIARGEKDPGLQPPSPEVARTEEALRRSAAAAAAAKPKEPDPEVEDESLSNLAAPEVEDGSLSNLAEPEPQPPIPEPIRASPGDLGPPASAPVRSVDLSSLEGADVVVDVRALLRRTLGQERIGAADADGALAELASGVEARRSGPAVRRQPPPKPPRAEPTPAPAAAAPKPEPRREAARRTPPPIPAVTPPPPPAAAHAVKTPAPMPAVRTPAPFAAVSAPPTPAEPPAPADEELPEEASSARRVMRDLFEDSDVVPMPTADDEPPPLPELQEVPPQGAARRPAEPADLASLFDEADMLEAGPSVLDEPLEDDFGGRPSVPPPVPPADVDLETPIYDDFSGPAPTTEVANLLADLSEPLDEGARSIEPAPPPPLDEPLSESDSGDPVAILDDSGKPKKGFFKKLFGK